MAVIEYDAYKQKLLALEPTLKELEQALNIESARKELSELQIETEQEGFWNDVERSQRIAQKIKRLENKIKKYDHLVSDWEDTLTLCEMAQEEDDASQLDEVAQGCETLEKEISERRLAALLTGEYDANNAILTFHAGAGGTEAQDWTEMLYRMYTRWAERHGYTYQLMDYHRGGQRLRLSQERKRRTPPGAGEPLRCQCPAADQLFRPGGHAGNRGRQRN